MKTWLASHRSLLFSSLHFSLQNRRCPGQWNGEVRTIRPSPSAQPSRQPTALCSYSRSSQSPMPNHSLSVTRRLQAAKLKSGKSYTHIAQETGLTNVYVAQLLRRQAHLKSETAPKLRVALPALTDDLVQEMLRPPMRSYDPQLIQEPTIYRLNEAVNHFGESIKEIINEEFGDGMY